MKYVYILQRIAADDRYYVGVTDNLRARLAKHNAGDVSHTSKYRPCRLKTYIAFADERQALAFERYLQVASGRAFVRKRL
jgi:predicted GIY-YIG superfamily endonuclease